MDLSLGKCKQAHGVWSRPRFIFFFFVFYLILFLFHNEFDAVLYIEKNTYRPVKGNYTQLLYINKK